jgi:hypothetical protein
MQFLPRDDPFVPQREEQGIPPARSAISFGSYQDMGMEGMEHVPVTQNESNDLRSASAKQVDTEHLRSFLNTSCDLRADVVSSRGHARHCCPTDTCHLRYFLERALLSHVLPPCGRRRTKPNGNFNGTHEGQLGAKYSYASYHKSPEAC